MVPKILSTIGQVVSIVCLVIATSIQPAGFDWSRDFISTLLRGPAGPARTVADVGVLIFCASLAFVFVRLAGAQEFANKAKVIRISGIGSQVYAGLIITPMHDLMVTISLVFLIVGLATLIHSLFINREKLLFILGSVCLSLLLMSATLYYTSHFVSLLPWAQRITFSLIAIWLTLLDFSFPRKA